VLNDEVGGLVEAEREDSHMKKEVAYMIRVRGRGKSETKREGRGRLSYVGALIKARRKRRWENKSPKRERNKKTKGINVKTEGNGIY